MDLSQSIEDYLEIIYTLNREKQNVRVKHIASNLGVSLPSVTEMIRKLTAKNLVSYKRYGPVKLTSKGEGIAKSVYSKHKLLADFFMSLGIDEKTALHDACLAEHVLSRKTLNRLRVFTMDKKRG